MSNKRETVIVKDEVYEKILPKEEGRLFDAPYYTEFKHHRRNNDNMALSKYKRISKDYYVDIETGEVKQYTRRNRKTEEGFKKNHENIPKIIKGYFRGDNSERHIILKYDKPIYKPVLLTNDFNNFLRRFGKICPNFIYLYGKEPFIDGSWHIHCIIKVTNGEFIFDEFIEKLWGNGTVKRKKIRDINRFCWKFDILRIKEKRQRLFYYPSNFHPFGYTRGLNNKMIKVQYKDLSKYVKNKELIYKQQYSIGCLNNRGEFNSFGKLKYEQYELR